MDGQSSDLLMKGQRGRCLLDGWHFLQQDSENNLRKMSEVTHGVRLQALFKA